MTKRALELLAPAKNVACGMAAIDHGADAVYIGAPRFGARAAAGNSVADIAQLCQYAHQFRAKVYATVNTIIYDDELEDTRLLLEQLAEAQVDAILVQDMALLAFHSSLITHHSSLQYHASTQTDNRTAEKVRWLSSLGFSRVVLARELSVDEIAAIHRAVPDVELEVFVHGALCISYSGQCYASQHCFGRSANRGECAQFCRMKFDLTDADGRMIEHDRYLLSLKDLNQSEHLGELIEAGATSFKIEGRLKDLAYVKNVTAAYSQLLDRYIAQHSDRYERASLGRCRYTFTPDLRKTFNRGYTTYFLHGRQPANRREAGLSDASIASFDTPKAMGEFVGTVKEIRGASFTVAGTAAFSNGDGLCYLVGEASKLCAVGEASKLYSNSKELIGFRVNRAEGNRLFPLTMPPGLRPGTRLYRNNDQQMERLLSKPSAERKIPVTMSLRPTATGFALNINTLLQSLEASPTMQSLEASPTMQSLEASPTMQSLEASPTTVSIECEHQKAEKPQRENIVRQLTKLGGTIFECNDIDLPEDFDYFIPSSLLAELRRKAVAAATESQHTERTTMLNDSWPTPGAQPSTPGVQPPSYPLPYLYNAANGPARQFYHDRGISAAPAFELQEPQGEKLIMQCRHCLRYTLGFCVKHGGRRPTWREPLFLRLGDGRRFRLEFDCKNCQMNVISDK